MAKNRIEEYFDSSSSNNQVVFEKFQPTMMGIVRSSEDMYEEEEESQMTFIPQPNAINDINIWVGHIKNNITIDLVNRIKDVDGVEMLRPYSRYRFGVGIGKLFNENTVKSEISKVIREYMNPSKD